MKIRKGLKDGRMANMIITATSYKESHAVKSLLKTLGFEYRGSIYWPEEWRKDDTIVYVHKGYHNGQVNHEWRAYMK